MKNSKFRVWDNLAQKMIFEGFAVIGEVTVFGGVDQYAIENKGDRETLLDRYNDMVITESVGLVDSQGVELYECDIVKFKYRSHEHGDVEDLTGIIAWDQETASFGVANTEGGDVWLLFSDYGVNANRMEIVGNIFKDKHLLQP